MDGPAWCIYPTAGHEQSACVEGGGSAGGGGGTRALTTGFRRPPPTALIYHSSHRRRVLYRRPDPVGGQLRVRRSHYYPPQHPRQGGALPRIALVITPTLPSSSCRLPAQPHLPSPHVIFSAPAHGASRVRWWPAGIPSAALALRPSDGRPCRFSGRRLHRVCGVGSIDGDLAAADAVEGSARWLGAYSDCEPVIALLAAGGAGQ